MPLDVADPKFVELETQRPSRGMAGNHPINPLTVGRHDLVSGIIPDKQVSSPAW
ncbi:MAG: hypothetical protein KBD04_04105 [Proteobacteria bacterium]|nr:hypothetical protein [Pseudomonadota bacterium]